MDTNNCFGFNKNTNLAEFDKQAAKYLEKAVRKLPPRKTGITNTRPSSWANHIRKLRILDNIKEEEIKRTLKWYALHIGEEFVPEAFSGGSFRKKYSAIRRQYEKEISLLTEITKESLQIVEYLNTLSWPTKAAKALPTAVQFSLTSYENWVSDLRVYSKQTTAQHKKWESENLPQKRKRTPPTNVLFASWLLSIIPSKQHFIRGWFEEVNKNTRNWYDWNGDLSRFCFRIENNKRFQEIGKKWAVEFSGNPDLWDRFCVKMKEFKK